MALEGHFDPQRLLDLGDTHPELFEALLAAVVDRSGSYVSPADPGPSGATPAEVSAFFAR